jgi:cell division septal protein FtsQ
MVAACRGERGRVISMSSIYVQVSWRVHMSNKSVHHASESERAKRLAHAAGKGVRKQAAQAVSAYAHQKYGPAAGGPLISCGLMREICGPPHQVPLAP